MLKTMHPDEMVQTIRRVYAGKRCVLTQMAALLAEHYSEDSLTTREIEVLRQIAGGNRNRDIAENLFISEQTVKAYFTHFREAGSE